MPDSIEQPSNRQAISDDVLRTLSRGDTLRFWLDGEIHEMKYLGPDAPKNLCPRLFIGNGL